MDETHQKETCFIITVHGTGAGEYSEARPKWWQANSHFSKEISANLTKPSVVSPFNWDGANSEVARRDGGTQLFRFIKKHEANKQEYHLVGHSHGGSVIWHALEHAATAKIPLQYLGSVTTVGTPFMQYGPRIGILLLIPIIFITIYAFFNLIPESIFSPDEIHKIYRDSTYTNILMLLLLGAFLFFGLLVAINRIFSLLAAMLRYRKSQLNSNRAIGEYSYKSLHLFHELDEPIAGLRVTLLATPNLIPTPTPFHTRYLSFLKILWREIFAKQIDEFAWQVVVRRLQGSDLSSEQLLSVSPGPDGAMTALLPIDGEPAEEIAHNVSNATGPAITRLRELLSRLSTGKVLKLGADEIANSIDWSAVIHNSYFDSKSVITTIIKHIKSPKKSEFSDNSVKLDFTNFCKRWDIIYSTFFACFMLIFSIGFISFYSVFMEPLTNANALTSTRSVLLDQQYIGSSEEPYLAEAWSIAASDRPVSTNIKFLQNIGGINTRVMLEARYGWSLGFEGDVDAIEELLNSDKNNLDEFQIGQRKLMVGMYALAGLLTAKAEIPPHLINTVIGYQKNDVVAFRSLSLLKALLPTFARERQTVLLKSYLSNLAKFGYCEELAKLFTRHDKSMRAQVEIDCGQSVGNEPLEESHSNPRFHIKPEWFYPADEIDDPWWDTKWTLFSDEKDGAEREADRRILIASLQIDRRNTLTHVSCKFVKEREMRFAKRAADLAGRIDINEEPSYFFQGSNAAYWFLLFVGEFDNAQEKEKTLGHLLAPFSFPPFQISPASTHEQEPILHASANPSKSDFSSCFSVFIHSHLTPEELGL